MNNLEQLAPPIHVAAPTPIQLSMASSNLSHREEKQLESPRPACDVANLEQRRGGC